MLTPEQLQNLPTRLIERYSELAEFVLRDIARRIAKTSQITETAEYQLIRARELGLSEKEIAAKIAEINNVAESEIDTLIRDAAKKSDEFDRAMLGDDGSGAAIPLEENEQLQQMMAAEIKNTQNACVNFTGTTGFAMRNARGKVVYSSTTDTMRKLMDDAHFKVINGVTDYNTAVRQACAALAESGLRTVYYESGHSDRIEVAVRRALMTSVSQVTQAIAEENAEELEADGWEISAHVGARPSHAIYQGRQYPKKDYERIVKPLIDDYNCRHSAFPIIMGVSEPIYTEQELADMEKPVTYKGKEYTPYEAQQQMRKMERAMRKQKDRCIVADAAGNKDNFTAASIKLRRQKDIYEDFCKQTGNYTNYERTLVQGYNRHLSGKTGAVTRKQRAAANAQITLGGLTKGRKSGTISPTTFTPASDIRGAEEYARKTLGIKNVSYKGVDVTTANEWNRGLADSFSRFPELRKKFGFVGECHERNAALKPTVVQYITDLYVQQNPNFSLQQLQPYIDKEVRKTMRKLAISTHTMAQSFSPNISELDDFRGITINRNFGKDSKKFLGDLKHDVGTKFHPEHCDTIRSVLDHEIGHQLDDLLGIRSIKEIRDLFDSRTTQQITDDLSKYAWDNSNADRYSEFIAEAWAEYCNSPAPREIAKAVGETIEKQYKAKFGKP